MVIIFIYFRQRCLFLCFCFCLHLRFPLQKAHHFLFSLCSCYHLFAAQPNPEFRQLLIIGHPATSMPNKSHQSRKNDYRYYLSRSRSTWNTRRSSLLEKNPDNPEDQWETLSPKRPPSGTPCLAHERAGCVQRCFVGEHLEVSLDLPRNYIFRYCIFRYVKVDETMRPYTTSITCGWHQ